MAERKSPIKRRQQLRWKLALSYAVVTVLALLTVELLLIAGAGVAISALLNSGELPAQLIEVAAIDYEPTLRSYLSKTPPDLDGIADMLKRLDTISSRSIPLTFSAEEFLVVDAAGTVLGAKPIDLMGVASIGESLAQNVIPELTDPLLAALAGEEDVGKLFTLGGPGERVIMVVPVWDLGHTAVIGALVGMGEIPSVLGFLGDAAPILGGSALLFTAIAGFIGIVYGFLAARGPVARLSQITEASEAWGRGEFSESVEDSSGDELGQLARQLNEMADQLEHLMDTRRELAVLKERNRLARDLHDTVKQLAFAASAQIGTARTLISNDPQAAKRSIEEAERITDELRQELSNLILELAPPALEDKGLATALREYTESWSRQNNIPVDIRIQGERPLPPEVEETAFRITQEALANAARHSNARNVHVNLNFASDGIRGEIKDNGSGFDSSVENQGFGLRSMAERASALGGELSVHSKPNEGTRVSVSLPIDQTSEFSEGQEDG
jgi:signal transduction histidine kinase